MVKPLMTPIVCDIKSSGGMQKNIRASGKGDQSDEQAKFLIDARFQNSSIGLFEQSSRLILEAAKKKSN